MENMHGCQLPNIPNLAEGLEQVEPQALLRRLKRSLAVPWNYYVKRWIKQAYHLYTKQTGQAKSKKSAQPAQMELRQPVPIPQTDQPIDTRQPVKAIEPAQPEKLKAGDWVRVRSWEEIQPLLDPFKETRGCAFLEDMRQYCGTEQRILKSMERFLDERDYKVKKVNGVILLENVICKGTPAFGKCDRCCFLFWREEWLEKITS